MPIENQSKANKLSTSILNYFAAFTVTSQKVRGISAPMGLPEPLDIS